MKRTGSTAVSLILALAMLFGMAPFGWNGVYAEDSAKKEPAFDDSRFRPAAASGIREGMDLCVNLRELMNQKPGKGYSVVQGGCTDGIFAYYMMVSSSNQKGKVLKVRLSDHKDVKRGPVVDICHGNGMTYDSKRHWLVVVGREARRCELVIIDANTLKAIGRTSVDYSRTNEEWPVKNASGYYGLAAISYIPQYDCYVALQRTTHSLIVMNSDFQVIGFVKTRIYTRYSGTYQAIDADEKYIYLLLSADQERPASQPYNLILALDWNSEMLLPYVNGAEPDFAKIWMCNNDNSGREDAVIRVATPNEAENLYHITDGNGQEHFFMSEYADVSGHTYVTKKIKKRVKVKKVKKNGRTVWKYRTKYVKKRVKKKIKRAYRKDDFVYYLGVI